MTRVFWDEMKAGVAARGGLACLRRSRRAPFSPGSRLEAEKGNNRFSVAGAIGFACWNARPEEAVWTGTTATTP